MNPTEERSPCIRGCIRKGTDEPLPARHGPYCNRCYYQYLRALEIAADVVEHTVSLVTFQSRSDDRVDTSRSAPLPFNLEAFHDANDTYTGLAHWGRIWADQLHQNLPSTAGKVWRNRAGRIVGLRAGAPAHQAKLQTKHLVRWLTGRLDAILELATDNTSVQDDLDAWRDDLKSIWRTNARWPRDPQPRYSDMPCADDDCGGRIAVFPPLEFGADERIVCERCGRHYEPGNYEFLIRVFQDVQLHREKSARVARHLAAKYKIGGQA